MKKLRNKRKAQTAIEYMVLLGAITAVALVGFSTYLPRAKDMALGMFNRTARQLLGDSADDGKARTLMSNADYP